MVPIGYFFVVVEERSCLIVLKYIWEAANQWRDLVLLCYWNEQGKSTTRLMLNADVKRLHAWSYPLIVAILFQLQPPVVTPENTYASTDAFMKGNIGIPPLTKKAVGERGNRLVVRPLSSRSSFTNSRNTRQSSGKSGWKNMEWLVCVSLHAKLFFLLTGAIIIYEAVGQNFRVPAYRMCPCFDCHALVLFALNVTICGRKLNKSDVPSFDKCYLVEDAFLEDASSGVVLKKDMGKLGFFLLRISQQINSEAPPLLYI